MAAKAPTKRPSGRKRGHGEGSITQRKDGLWQGCLMVGYQSNGKPDRRYVSGKMRRHGQSKLSELVRQNEQNMLAENDRTHETLAGFLVRWLETTETTVRATTRQWYSRMVRVHIQPGLGRLRLNRLRPDDILSFYSAKLAAGCSPQTVIHIHRVLHRALHMGVGWGYVPQ